MVARLAPRSAPDVAAGADAAAAGVARSADAGAAAAGACAATGAGDARAGPSAPAPLLAACTSTTWYVGFGFALLVQIPMAQRERRERRQEREGGLECVTRSSTPLQRQKGAAGPENSGPLVLAWRP